jgi:hypothetical protein
MKAITVRFWVSDDTPTNAIDGSHVNLATLRDYLLTLDQQTSAGQLTEKEITTIADGIAEREYRETVSGIVEDLKRAVHDGEVTDRDGAMDWLHDTIDGHHDVIYTYAAQEVVRHSRNDGAYFEQFGDEGAVKDGAINWSVLAYCALEADVLEEIGDLDEWFQCSECNGDVTADDVKAAGDDLPVCADCREESEPESEGEGGSDGD